METVTLSDFIKGADISMTYRATDHNPHLDNSDRMDHWRVTLRAGRSRMTLVFSKGIGHNGEPPTLEEILDCLASDAAGFENTRNFEDWCSEYGYETDSRRAERVYKAIQNQVARLKNLLGHSAYETLLWKVQQL
jgi:hypothetical protein